MSGFDYRPKIDYIPKDIDTIDNVGGNPIYGPKTESYMNNLAADVITRLNDNLSRIDNIKSIIDGRLKDTVVHGNKSILDDVTKELLQNMEDGNKFITDGMITYNLYKQCLDEPLLQNVAYEWDNYQSGINGEIEAEVLPYVSVIEKDTKSALDVISSTVIYDKSSTNVDEIRKQEAKEIDNYVGLVSKLDGLYKSDAIDIQQINLVRKDRDKVESRLNNNRNITSTLGEFADETVEILDTMEDIVDETSKTERVKKNSDAAARLNNKLVRNMEEKSKKKLLVYQGFKAQRENIFARKEEFTSSVSGEAKEQVYKEVVKNSRLYTDVAIDALNEIDYMVMDEEDEYSMLSIVAGSYDIRDKQVKSMLDMKNALKTTTMSVKNHINDISNKDKTRVIYRNM